MSQPLKKTVPAPIVCSFCDHDQNQVAHIITGKPGIAICDECIGICVQTIIVETRKERGLATNLGGQG